MWSSVFSNDSQYFTSYITSLVTLSGSNSKLSVTDMLSGFHHFVMSDMLSCCSIELTTGHNGSLLSKVNSYQSSGCDSSLKLLSGNESKSLLLTDVLSDAQQFNFSDQMNCFSSVVKIDGDFGLLWNKSDQHSSISSHKIKDDFLSACVRTAWYVCPMNNINLIVKHIRGEVNTYADILSHWNFYKKKVTVEVKELLQCKWVQPNSNLILPVFSL